MRTKRALQKQAKKLLHVSLNDVGLVEKKRVDQVLGFIAAQPQSEQLPLLRAYKRLLERYEQAHTAIIEVADASNKHLVSVLEKEITKRYGEGMTIAVSENPSAIAGIKVTVNDVIFDTTVAAQFAAIKESIS